MIVVSDTSAINALLHVKQVHLLSQLFGKIYIPAAVKTELDHSHQILPAFIHVAVINNVDFRQRLEVRLDPGEAEAIVLAKELNADYLLIDEQYGRRIAQQEGLRVIGLMGALLIAKKKGLILSLRAITAEIEAKANFRISEEVKEYLFIEAGE